jgi:hypothetical protein
MDEVSVYRFQVWDHEVRDNVWAPRMATQEAIKREHGVADLLTETRVDKADVDGDGFYPEEKTIRESALTALRPDQVEPARWYFGVRCNACDRPVAMLEDPLQGMGEEAWKLTKLMRAECPYCRAVSYAQELRRFRSARSYA